MNKKQQRKCQMCGKITSTSAVEELPLNYSLLNLKIGSQFAVVDQLEPQAYQSPEANLPTNAAAKNLLLKYKSLPLSSHPTH